MLRYTPLLLALAAPLVAATPATIDLSWEPVTTRTDGSAMTPAGYSAECGFSPDVLEPVTVTGTSASWDAVLPTDAGTVTCEVRAVDEFGVLSAPAIASADWSIADLAKPSAPVTITIELTISCEPSRACSVSVSP